MAEMPAQNLVAPSLTGVSHSYQTAEHVARPSHAASPQEVVQDCLVALRKEVRQIP